MVEQSCIHKKRIKKVPHRKEINFQFAVVLVVVVVVADVFVFPPLIMVDESFQIEFNRPCRFTP